MNEEKNTSENTNNTTNTSNANTNHNNLNSYNRDSIHNKTNNQGTLSIYQKYLELIYYTNNLIIKFPRSEKFALSTEIKHNLYEGLSYLLKAIKLYNKKDKLVNLFELDVTLSILKVQIRLADKYRYISKQNYTTWSEHITDICNMLGGWINSCQRR